MNPTTGPYCPLTRQGILKPIAVRTRPPKKTLKNRNRRGPCRGIFHRVCRRKQKSVLLTPCLWDSPIAVTPSGELSKDLTSSVSSGVALDIINAGRDSLDPLIVATVDSWENLNLPPAPAMEPSTHENIHQSLEPAAPEPEEGTWLGWLVSYAQAIISSSGLLRRRPPARSPAYAPSLSFILFLSEATFQLAACCCCCYCC